MAFRCQLSLLPSDLQPFLVVWTEELEGLVDLHTLSPVLPNIELYREDGDTLDHLSLLHET